MNHAIGQQWIIHNPYLKYTICRRKKVYSDFSIPIINFAWSTFACGGDTSLLEYRIELIDGQDDETFDGDTSYLELGCTSLGTQNVRLWVIDPTGTSDYCDVVLTLQDNGSYCPGNGGTVTVRENLETETSTPIVREGVRFGFESGSGISNAEPSDVELKVEDVIQNRLVEDGFALYQNRPNPFKFETVIGFYLPEASSARLTIYDVTGKLLKVVEGDYSKGYQEEVLLHADLNALGVVYYQLDTPGFTATRKMVLVR